jgi:hypothetical protein
MAVAAVGAQPAVIVNYAPVYLWIDFAFPTTDTLAAVVDNEVYVLAVFSTVHMKTAPGTVQVLGV